MAVKTAAQLMAQAGLPTRVACRYKATTYSGHGLLAADMLTIFADPRWFGCAYGPRTTWSGSTGRFADGNG